MLTFEQLSMLRLAGFLLLLVAFGAFAIWVAGSSSYLTLFKWIMWLGGLGGIGCLGVYYYEAKSECDNLSPDECARSKNCRTNAKGACSAVATNLLVNGPHRKILEKLRATQNARKALQDGDK